MRFLKTGGLVLTGFDLMEQDKIVVFYTPSGMLKVVVKGARRIKSRFAPLVSLPCYAELLIYRKRESEMGILTDGKIKHLFPGIRGDIFKFAQANHLAEVVLFSTREGKEDREIFDLLLKTFFMIEREKRENLEIVSLAFKLKFLHLLGYTPELKKCTICGRKREFFKTYYFSPVYGGIICETCQKGRTRVKNISEFTLLTMDFLLQNKIEKAPSSGFNQITGQIEDLLEKYFCYHVGERKIPKSSLFIKNLKKCFIKEGT